jgi:ribonuclease-3
MDTKFLINDIIIRIRLLTVKQKEPYLLFRKILGFYPNKIELYELAIRHKSLSTRDNKGLKINNERLEFLGDSVLNTLVSDILFKHYENASEGFLSKTRARIVQRESVNKIAVELGLNNLVVTTTNFETTHLTIYGNALEAIIGAIYLDQGYKRCRQFLEQKIFDQFINIDSISSFDANFKSALLEWGQKEKNNVEFITEEATQSSEKGFRFVAKVLLNNEQISSGSGMTKKEAQQNASKNALEYIKNNDLYQ